MKTKERIVATALKLFNKHGLSGVTVRNISEDLEMSPGNFSYHFPDKNLVISRLYEDMLGEMEEAIATIPQAQPGIEFFLEVHRKMFLVQHKYRFFYLNLFEILHHHKDIRRSFRQRYKMEQKLGQTLLEMFMAENVIVPGISKEQFESLIHLGQILNNSWAVDAEINFSGSFQDKMLHYMHLCCGRLAPFLSPQAQKAYDAYFYKLGMKNKVK